MKKVLLLSVLMFILVSPIVLADNFTIGVTKSDKYLAGRTGEIELMITNSGPKDIFSISVIGTPSGWLTSEVSAVELSRDQTKTVKIYVNPSKDASPKLYEYFINVMSNSGGEKIEKQLILDIQQTVEIIISDPTLSCGSCSDNVKISGMVENTGTTDFEDVSLRLTLEDQVIDIPIGKLVTGDKKAFDNTFLLEGYRPKTYDIKADVISGDRTVYNVVKQFSIPTVKDVKYSEKSSKTVFGNFVTLTAENKGNDMDKAVFESALDKSWYAYYAGPKPDETADKSVWNMDIDAGEKIDLKYSEIYWPTYVFIIAVILIGLFAYLRYTALDIRKSIKGRNIAEKGKELSVSIVIKNRVREMTNAVVKDIVPKEFDITGGFETVKPTLRKTTQGTELIWKLGRIKAYEQRVLHYKIKPVRIIKRMNLPGATIVAKYFERMIIKNSNYVAVYSKEYMPSTLAVEVSE